jgi:hypothetical protein
VAGRSLQDSSIIMPVAEFLRRQAESCLRTARGCFDLASAERMRIMAAEFAAKAAEIDAEQGDQKQIAPHLIARHSVSSQNNDR